MAKKQSWLLLMGLGIALLASFAIGRQIGFSRGRRAPPAVLRYPPIGAKWGQEGTVDVCLQTGRPHSVTDVLDGDIATTIQGTLLGFGDARALAALPGTAVPCDVAPENYVEVRDSTGEIWRVLYTLSGIEAAHPTVRVGAAVTIKFRAHWGFAKAAGFMLSDARGPVLAAEQGAFGNGLAPADEHPFDVRPAGAVGLIHEGCGDAVSHALQVFGTSPVRVLPGRTESVSLGAANYRFWNAASYTWVTFNCTDMLDRTSWFLWRS